MLVHLVPKLYLKYRNPVSLNRVIIDEHEIDIERLAVRKPFPNKCYHVACIRKGKKAIQGFLIELPENKDFTVTYLWEVEGLRSMEHVVNYTVIDNDFEMVSDDITLLYASSGKELGEFSSRWNDDNAFIIPASGQPYAEIVEPIKDKNSAFPYKDYMNGSFVTKRVENISLPTIEYDRFKIRGDHSGRFPVLEDRLMID